MKLREIRAKGVKELKKILEEKRSELFTLKLKHSLGQLGKTADLRNTKRGVARVLTLLNTKRETGGKGHDGQTGGE